MGNRLGELSGDRVRTKPIIHDIPGNNPRQVEGRAPSPVRMDPAERYLGLRRDQYADTFYLPFKRRARQQVWSPGIRGGTNSSCSYRNQHVLSLGKLDVVRCSPCISAWFSGSDNDGLGYETDGFERNNPTQRRWTRFRW